MITLRNATSRGLGTDKPDSWEFIRDRVGRSVRRAVINHHYLRLRGLAKRGRNRFQQILPAVLCRDDNGCSHERRLSAWAPHRQIPRFRKVRRAVAGDDADEDFHKTYRIVPPMTATAGFLRPATHIKEFKTH